MKKDKDCEFKMFMGPIIGFAIGYVGGFFVILLFEHFTR